MLAMRSSVCIDARTDQVWDRLAKLEDIRLWSEAILDARCAEGRNHGVGAQRTCRLTGGVTVEERCLAWEEGRSLSAESSLGVPGQTGEPLRTQENTMSAITEAVRRFLGADEQDATGPVQAVWNGVVLAESDRTVVVEGNHYFPPEDVRREYLEPSPRHSLCFWKGRASYYDAVVNGERNADAAWYYPSPSPAARKIKDHVAFWHGVKVTRASAPTAR
jgi:uncharacterized protein (DUF427 family)